MHRRIYVDHAATTPVRDDVLEAMLPFFGAGGFNASSPYAEGRAARAALDDARTLVARLLGAKAREIVFTGGGSEADNLAIVGGARAARQRGNRVVTIATEHHAVLHAVDALRAEGFETTLLPVDTAGRVDPAAFAAAIGPGTILVSIMLANNELGTIHPIAELAHIARERASGVVVHTDAVAAPGRIAVNAAELGVDLISLSAHKFYGPKGVGALYVRSGTPLTPLVVGGGQEHGLRAGTENVAGAVGFARALELAVAEHPAEAARLRFLRDRFERAITTVVPGVRVNAAAAERLPNIASIAFPDIDSTTLLVCCDLAGIAVSAGSACAAGSTEPSHVLAAIDAPDWARTGTLRFSFGKLTTEDDVERLIGMLPGLILERRVGVPDLGTSSSGWPRTFSEVVS